MQGIRKFTLLSSALALAAGLGLPAAAQAGDDGMRGTPFMPTTTSTTGSIIIPLMDGYRPATGITTTTPTRRRA